MSRFAILLLALASLPLLARTPPELPLQARIVAAVDTVTVDADMLDSLRSAISEGRGDGLAVADPVAFELAALQLLDQLAKREPTQPEREWVESLRGFEPQHWQQHPETLTPWFIPLFDVAGLAEATLLRWQQAAAVAQLLPDIERYARWTPALIAADPALQVLALESLGPDLRAALAEGSVPDALPAPTWIALLHDQGRDPVWQQALLRAPDESLRHSLRSVWRLEPTAARDWLERLRIERPALASSSVLALRADPDPERRQGRWLQLLEDRSARHAAAAGLAEDPELPDQVLIEAFANASPGARQQGLLLALRLRDTPVTRAFLRGALP